MEDKDKGLIFAGHLTLGEKPGEAHKKTIVDAKNLEGDLGIVFNDIDFNRRIWNYVAFGEAKLIKRCSRPLCGSNWRTIPEDLIDIEGYKSAYEILSPHFGLPQEEAWEAIPPEDKEFHRIVREEITPKIIDSHLKDYNLEIPNERVFLESRLRNVASSRLKSSRATGKKSWISQVEATGDREFLRVYSGSPTCGAILLALYERVSEQGYNHITQLYVEDDRKAIENATDICMRLHGAFPEESRWDLSFDNKFYS